MLDKFPKIAFYDREGKFFPLFGHANEMMMALKSNMTT